MNELPKESQTTPQYSLIRVRELAATQDVHFGSSRVQRDTANLQYSFEDVCQCLAELQDVDYHETVRYSSQTAWLDVYKMRNRTSSGHEDDLYIKFKLNRDCICIVLCSFHREGAL